MEEEELLASIGASVRDQDNYEENVIREATHQLAPDLTGIGFPPLHELAPTGDSEGPTDLPLFHDMLTKVRKEDSDLNRMKEQMILAYMRKEPTLQELERDQKRAKVARKTVQKSTVHTSKTEKPVSRGPDLAESRPAKRRKTMMDRKRKDNVDDEEAREKAEYLKQLREERNRRKEERRIAIFGEDQEEDSSSEEEAEFNDTQDTTDKTDSEVNSLAEENDAPGDFVTCESCSSKIPVPDGSDKDEVLAHHIASCQNQRSSRRREKSTTTDTSSKPASKTKKAKSSGKKRRRPIPNQPVTISIDDISEAAYEDRVDDWIKHGIDRMRVMSERDESEELPGDEEYEEGLYVPAWINDRLFGYQRIGLKWLWKLHLQQCGGIVGDQMGLGKTVQVSSYLGVLASSRKLKSILIVVPATMLQHWLTELARWAPGIRRILIHQSAENDGIARHLTKHMLNGLSKWLKRSRKERLYEAIDSQDIEKLGPHSFVGTAYAVITTYANLRLNQDIYVQHPWSYMVIDEAQTIRNPDADITLVCKRIRTPHRIAMTGTPIQNDLRELWSLFDYAFPGRLGTLPVFEQEFAEPIKKGGYKNASPMQVQLAYRCALTLKDLINPYMLRREKKDVKETSRMPAKKELVMLCRLTDQQRNLYEAYLRSDEVTRVRRGSANLLAAITMLRKICNHPDLVCDPDQTSVAAFIRSRGPTAQVNLITDSDSEDDDDYESFGDIDSLVGRSGKLQLLSRILPTWYEQGHRVLIFCQWKKTLNIIQRYCSLNGWKFGRLDGNTSVAARQRLVDRFNSDSSYFLMLCTTRTGGVGLNLTGANRVILFSPDWNPANDAQARERAWRFGQEKEVRIYRFITAGTVEEKIYHRQIFKSALSSTILQDPKQKRLFSQQQLKDLFTLKSDTGSFQEGGEGVTETGQITKGQGVIDTPDKDDSKDNNDALKSIMQSKGLAGIFDHDFLEEDPSRKSTTAREMEDAAKKFARDAAQTLRQSATGANPFVPAYGEETSEPKRFGSTGQGRSSSSAAILSGYRDRSVAAKTGGAITDFSQHSHLFSQLKSLLCRRRPTTEQIMNEFGDADPEVLRKLLRSIAQRGQDGRWKLTQGN